MRSVKRIHNSRYAPIADLVTYSPLPSASLPMLDPFLFLNHHGHQVYESNNSGLPFGPHPHRGMETVTFILEGDILHEDSGGHTSVIEAGGIQYMRAGKGLLHAETSSDNFKREGGPLEILQLWVNMPARLKMAEPLYIGKQSSEIPEVEIDRAKVHLVFGELNGTNGAIKHDALDIVLSWVDLPSGTSYKPDVPAEHTIFCYIVRGKLKINGLKVAERQLVEFDYGKGDIEIAAEQESIILFGHAKPLNEPVVAQGPFVMNTEDEIRQAYQDYQAGKFGSW